MDNQTQFKKSNGRGGKRPGAGRKPGAKSKRTELMERAIEARIEQRDGKIDPVEAMMEIVEWGVAQWRAMGEVVTEEGKPDPAYIAARAEIADIIVDWAAKAAPYIRPRLNAVEARVNVNVTIYERIERGRARIAA